MACDACVRECDLCAREAVKDLRRAGIRLLADVVLLALLVMAWLNGKAGPVSG